MPSNTTYNPPNIGSFVKSALNYAGAGVSIQATAGQTTTLDLTLADDSLLTGAWFVTSSGQYGDSITFQIVDVSGAITGTPNTVLKTFINSWYVPASADMQIDLEYPAKLITGLTIRLLYTSTGTSSAFVAINYKLHKVLQ